MIPGTAVINRMHEPERHKSLGLDRQQHVPWLSIREDWASHALISLNLRSSSLFLGQKPFSYHVRFLISRSGDTIPGL
jgi:hypothetical protein